MFVGHYGPAAGLAGGRVKLWHGFVAVQFLDILWAPFVLLGVEHVRIVENFTASNHFDLYNMPYTHSLVMAVMWSVLFGGAYHFWRKGGGLTAGGLVFSHWILDFVTHKPDLELWFGGPKVGLSLWDNRPVAISTELGLLILGLGIYLLRTTTKGLAGQVAPALLFVFLLAAQVFGNFGPPPQGPAAAAWTAIIAYALFAALAAGVDATREPGH